eukprot:3775439-Rhodomonas_salina.2
MLARVHSNAAVRVGQPFLLEVRQGLSSAAGTRGKSKWRTSALPRSRKCLHDEIQNDLRDRNGVACI